MFYFKSFTKKYFVSVVYTNNSVNDTINTQRVTDLKNLVGEPLSWAVDKQIYACQQPDGQTSYIMLKH